MPLILFQLVKSSGPVGTKRLWTETLQIGAKLCGFFLFAIFFNEAQSSVRIYLNFLLKRTDGP